MTLLDIQKLDIISIRKMLESKGDKKNLDNLIHAVLAFIQKYPEKNKCINPMFFQGMDIAALDISSFDKCDNILIYFAKHNIITCEVCKKLAIKAGAKKALLSLVKNNLLDGNELLKSFLESEKINEALDIFLHEYLPNVDANIFLENLVNSLANGAEVSINNLIKIIEDIPYTPCHEKIGEYIINNDNGLLRESIKRQLCLSKLNYYLGLPNAFQILADSPELISMLKNINSYSRNIFIRGTKVFQSLEANIAFWNSNILSLLKDGTISNRFALADYVFPFGDAVFDLVNYWATEGNTEAFDIYSAYFLNPNRDYENVGSLLDASYEKKINKKRERVKASDIESKN